MGEYKTMTDETVEMAADKMAEAFAATVPAFIGMPLKRRFVAVARASYRRGLLDGIEMIRNINDNKK